MKHTQVTAALLAMMMLASLASCGGEAASDDTTTNAVTDTTVAETSYIDTLEARDYGGQTFTFYGQSYDARQNFYMEEKAGDVANDALYERDMAVKDRLNVELVYIGEQDRGRVFSTAQTSILAGDEDYNVIMTALSDGINRLTTGNLLYDLRSIPYLTLDSVYWNKSMYENMEINGKQYFTTGPISYQFLLTPIVMRFNKRLVDEYQLGDLYQLVLDGKWTGDKLAEMVRDKYQDLNNNGKADEGDFFGLIIDNSYGNALYDAAGLDTISREGGEYKLVLDSQQSIDLIDKYSSYFGDRTQYLNDVNGDKGYQTNVFKPGNCIFMPTTVLGTIGLRDMEDDYGIIPNPKYTEEQEEYYTSCNTFLPSGVGVPVNCSDPEGLGLLLETMAYYSYEMVQPAMYELTLKGKATRDDVSAQMLDLIYSSCAFDFVTVFNFAKVNEMLRGMVVGETSNFVSSYAKIKDKAQAELDDLVAATMEE